MTREARLACALAAALAAGLAGVAHALAVPAIGLTRDDATYAAYAKALLAGLGYVDPADPGLPPADRYPIGFPLLLAAALAGAGGWPAELARLGWVGPVSLAAFFLASCLVLRRIGGWSWGAALGAAGATAIGHTALEAGGTVMSDLPAAAIGLVGLLLGDAALRGERAPGRWAACGAVLAAAALVRYAWLAGGLAVAGAIAWRALGARAGGTPQPTPLDGAGSPHEAGAERSTPFDDADSPHGAGARSVSRTVVLPFALGFGLPFGAWLAYRLRLGGESYGANAADFLPADAAGLAPRAVEAAWAFVAGGPGAMIVPQAAGPAAAPWPVLGAAVTAIAAYGTWRWLRAPGPRLGPRLGPIALVATAALAAGWTFVFVRLEPGLPARLMLAAAPLVWIAAGHGAAALLARAGRPASRAFAPDSREAAPAGTPPATVAPPALPPEAPPTLPSAATVPAAPKAPPLAAPGAGTARPRRAAIAAIAACVALAGFDSATRPRASAAERAAYGRLVEAGYAEVARRVPPDGVVLSPVHEATWLYAGRRGHSVPPGLADGALAPLDPFAMLLTTEHWRIGWIVVPAAVGATTFAGPAVQAFARAYPQALRPAGPALLRIDPGPFRALCGRLGVRGINARFEEQRP